MSTKRKAEDIVKKGTVVYIGPSLRGVADRNTIYNNGLPKELTGEIEKKPSLANLLVPLPQLAEAMKQINTRQGAYYAFYQKALQEGA